MKSKAYYISITAFCTALALIAMLVAGYLRWFVVVAAVAAAVAVATPMVLRFPRCGVFSLISYLVSVILASFLAVQNIGYIAIIATFAMPIALVKCLFESKKQPNAAANLSPFDTDNSTEPNNQSIGSTCYQAHDTVNLSPFDTDTQSNSLEPSKSTDSTEPHTNSATNSSKQHKKTTELGILLKWVVYYVICELSLAVSALSVYLLTPDILTAILEKNLLWVVIVPANLFVPFYNILLNGTFEIVKKAIKFS